MNKFKKMFFTLIILMVSSFSIYADNEYIRPALPFPPSIEVQTQCGLVNEQQDVERYNGSLGVKKEYVKTHEPSTVQLQWLNSSQIDKIIPNHRQGSIQGRRWCSGTLISQDLVLTAAHCFEIQTESKSGWITPFKKDSDGKTLSVKPATLAKLMQVNFNFQKNSKTLKNRPSIIFPITRLVEFGPNRSGTLDYAIIRVGPDSNGKLPGDVFSSATAIIRPPKINEKITIIQHPQGLPKKIDTGNITKINGSNVLYDNLDTHGGSSGSGVRDSDGNVIAVHTNGGCTKYFGGANRGVSNADISEVSDIL